MSAPDWRLLVCVNRRLGAETPSCAQRGAETLAEQLEALLRVRGLTLPVERILCFGSCSRGPNVRLAPGGAFFHGVTAADLEGVVEQVAAAIGTHGNPPDAC